MASRGGETAVAFEVGDKVKAMSPDDEQWYPGKIEDNNDDGSFKVRWDDPDGGPETNDIGTEHLKKVFIFKDYVVGDDCRAISDDDGAWYPGSVAKVNKDGTFQVKWDDADGGAETADVLPESMRKVIVFKGYQVGETVEAKFPEDGGMYAASVSKANKDGTFKVKWEDPDGGPEESTVGPKDMRYPPITLDKLEAGQKYRGVVKAIRPFGAFVGFGAVKDGLVHVSQITEDRVEDIHDHLEEGQEIDVWVSRVQDDGRIGLTMVESKVGGGGGGRAPVDWDAFEAVSSDEWFPGKVARLARFGAFVQVTLPDGPTAQGLVHVSQIRDGFVENIEDELEIGQEVQVRVVKVDPGANRLSLSMKEGGGGAPREPQDLSAFEDVASDQWLSAKVARIANFGAFVDVSVPDGEATATGLVHVTQIKDGFVESVADELEVGQEVQVRVVSVDSGAGKMSLSMKAEDGGYDSEDASEE